MNPYIIPGLKGAKLPIQIFMNKTTPNRIIEVTCDILQIDKELVAKKGRSRQIAEARHIISYIFVKKLGMTLDKVGKEYLGGRDHSTVINSIRKFNNLYETEDEFKNKVYSIMSNIVI